MSKQLKSIINKVLLSLGAFVVGNIPLGFIIICKYLLNPEGFWQRLVVYGVGIYIFGFIQIILWVLFIIFLIVMWKE